MFLRVLRQQLKKKDIQDNSFIKKFFSTNKVGKKDLEMEDLDKKIKQRILSQNDENNFQFDQNQFKQSLKSAYMLMTHQMHHDEKKVKSFKQQIIMEEDDPLMKSQKNEDAKNEQEIDEYLSKGSQEQQMEKLYRVKDSLREQREWNLNIDEERKMVQEYGAYDKFQGFWAGQKDKSYCSDDDLPGSSIGRTFRQMALKLQKEEKVDFIDHEEQEEEMRQLRNQSMSGRPEDADLLREEEILNQQFELEYQEYMDEIDFTRVSYDIFGEQEESDTETNLTNPFTGRLSPSAKEKIYQLHNQGQSIKQISDRFGILPERVKVIIWQKKYFYDEILPELTLTTVRLGIEAEDMYDAEFGFQDFGIDLHRILDREKGMHMKHFIFDAVDIKKSETQFVKDRMRELMAKKKHKKYEYIQEKFVGEGLKGYQVKEWKWYKGKGTDRLSRIFKRCLLHSHQTYRLPQSVQKQLKAGKGPREAVLGTKHHSR